MGILIDKIRISGFRGLKDFEMTLSETTVLTGTNNVGKTTILKAIQLALGSKSFLSVDDLNISNTGKADKIIVDVKISPVNESGEKQTEFEEEWEAVFTSDNIQYIETKACVPIRTTAIYNTLKSDFDKTQTILKEWEPTEGEVWQNLKTTKNKLNLEDIPFFYIEAQRDVVEDVKLRSSYLGKMLSDVAEAYKPEDIKALEGIIDDLNKEAVDKSSILSTIQTVLEGVDSAMDKKGSKVEITPFAKKIRDLNKNISIRYGENDNSFTMDYHGMGTRSWSSLLTFKAFVVQNAKIAKEKEQPFFPIIAIEEPEAHLHPNAQKRLYWQMSEMPGQKIISTHSPYIASCADFNEIRGLYKDGNSVKCGLINQDELSVADRRKLRQKVINTKGEIFFSKAIVLFEGETEEQALPIFAEKYFERPALELGIDFIGVGGFGQYLPFLQFAESLNIPWYIFSDGEDGPIAKITSIVKKIKGDSFVKLEDENNIFIIKNKLDFEGMLINDGYISEIENALETLFGDDCVNDYLNKRNGTLKGRIKTNVICDKCKQNIYTDVVRTYISHEGYKNALNDFMSDYKTSIGPVIAEEIVKSDKGLPVLIKELFDKIKSDLSYE